MEQVSQGATYVRDGSRQRQARVPGSSRGGTRWEAVPGTHRCQGPAPQQSRTRQGLPRLTTGGQRCWRVQDSLRGPRVPVGAASPP